MSDRTEEIREIEDFLTESNAIEGVFGVEALNDSKVAWYWLTGRKNLTVPNILKAHKAIMSSRTDLDPKYKGTIRDIPVWIGGNQAVPPMVVKDLLERWVLRANKLGDPIADHVWFEHIHPFVDGNGRTGRLLMNWQYRKKGEPLKIYRSDERREYYKLFK